MESARLGLNIQNKDKLNNEESVMSAKLLVLLDSTHMNTEDDFNMPPPLTQVHLMQYLIEGTNYYT